MPCEAVKVPMARAGGRAQPLCVAGCRDRAAAEGTILLEEDVPISDVAVEGSGCLLYTSDAADDM
eukprot:7938592-Alexandrium_andersonii.AAC.1